ncbi:MAG: ABC transporter permease subunit [Thermoplasmata archaeon]
MAGGTLGNDDVHAMGRPVTVVPEEALPPSEAVAGISRPSADTLLPEIHRPILSGPARYALRRLLLIPAQLVFVLLVLYLVIEVPISLTQAPPESLTGIDRGFFQLVFNIFTGNWGTTEYSIGQTGFLNLHLTWIQVFAYYIPSSIQLALFALPIAAVLAYPISLYAGWSRRPGIDAPARLVTLTGALLPVFVVGTLVLNALFLGYLGYFQDIPSQGLLPADFWFFDRGGYPSWILYQFATQPTGMPLVDAVIHHAWTIAAISFTKTLIQASVVAIAYVAIFFRHARSIARSVREEVYIVGARSRGISERTLLWRHAARAVTPSFLLIFALTIPEYLGVQFAVEVAFVDQSGFGYLIFASLTTGQLAPVVPLVFLIAIVVLVWALLVDLIALRLDPRGLAGR